MVDTSSALRNFVSLFLPSYLSQSAIYACVNLVVLNICSLISFVKNILGNGARLTPRIYRTLTPQYEPPDREREDLRLHALVSAHPSPRL